MKRYADTDLTFFVHCYQDPRWLDRALAFLRQWYRSARVLVVSDGDDDPRLALLAGRHDADFCRERKRLFLKEHGGMVTQRMLAKFLARPTRWLIKIDTDTKICRRLARLPGHRCLFGTLQEARPSLTSIQGGFVGYEVRAAAGLYVSGLLADPALADYRNTWAKDNADLQRYVESTGRTSTDWTVGYCVGRLGIPMVQHPEVRSVWRAPQADDGRFAVIHPAQEMYNIPRL